MDIKMPDMTGVAALKVIRTRWPAVKVVLMTGYAGAELINEAKSAGAVQVLSKPLDLSSLLRLLEREFPGGNPSA
jgi:two-component system response regulator AtoC